MAGNLYVQYFTAFLSFIKFASLGLLCFQFPVECSQVFIGRPCTTGGFTSVRGECKLLPDCPSALSSLRAGRSPTLCYQENDVPVICCQSEKRISERKCVEYSQQLFEQQAKSSIPGFAPFYASEYENSNPGPGRYGNGAPVGTCNFTNALPFISGGRPADRHEMSFTVALGHDEPGKGIAWKCGGTLISGQFVLTAAHCLDGHASKRPTHILLGDKHLQKLDSFSSGQRIEARVKEIIIHPDYQRPVKYNDIGLIKLDRQVKFSRMIYPACLPQPDQRPESLSELLIAGWGRLEYFGKRGDILQVVNITRYSVKDCTKIYTSETELPEGIVKKQICAGDKEGNKDTCDGDSGGPLVSKQDKVSCMHFIIGLTSFGDQFCGSGTPGVYTNIQSYLDWIESVVWND